jgi:hypothetical protein
MLPIFIFKAPKVLVNNATTSDIKHNSSIIQWSPLSASAVPGVLVGYIITSYDVLRGVNITRIVCANSSSLELIDLLPYTEYQIYVSAFTVAGAGSANKVTDFVTLEAGKQSITAYSLFFCSIFFYRVETKYIGL